MLAINFGVYILCIVFFCKLIIANDDVCDAFNDNCDSSENAHKSEVYKRGLNLFVYSTVRFVH